MRHHQSPAIALCLLYLAGSPGEAREAARPTANSERKHNATHRAGTDAVARIQLSGKQARLSEALAEGYARLERYDLAGADTSYRQALLDDPKNVDALLALGAIAWQTGRHSESRHFRQQALTAAPGDPEVQAANLAGPQTSVAAALSESRLRNLLASQPEAGALHFALGNLMARMDRWPAARDAYTHAVNIDGDNPDYLFNLAVSHEHLRLSAKAIALYQAALAASERRPAAFDRSRARLRLEELAP